MKKINTKHSTISNTNSIIKKKEEKKKEETSSENQCETQFLFNSSPLMNLENQLLHRLFKDWLDQLVAELRRYGVSEKEIEEWLRLPEE